MRGLQWRCTAASGLCGFRSFLSTSSLQSPQLYSQRPCMIVASHARGLCGDQSISSAAVCTARRCKTSYSSLTRTRRDRGARKSAKNYNYLTSAPMIKVKQQRNVAAVRRRDDKGMARRIQYKEQLHKNVQEKIRFFPPFLTEFIFFPLSPQTRRSVIFKGNRDLTLPVATRVACLVVEQLKKAEMRPFLIEKMKELKVELPTTAEWQKFTDPYTGDINIGILYSDWMVRIFRVYSRLAKQHGNAPTVLRALATARDYIALHYRDRSVVPSLEDWARGVGPLTKASIMHRTSRRSNPLATSHTQVREVREHGKSQVLAKLSTLSLEEQVAIMAEATRRRQELVQEMEERHLFITKFKEVLYSLDEMKSITLPAERYRSGFARQFVLQHGGAYYPTYQHTGPSYTQLPPEEKTRLCTFGMSYLGHPSTGQKLYIRYCSHDYGMHLKESVRRYNSLSELQRAAICFPFYLPINPSRASTAAFSRFYSEMFRRYGLVSKGRGTPRASAVFERTMRLRWMALSPQERVRYEESDRMSDVFPLVKPGTAATPSLPSSSSSTSSAARAATMDEYFTEDSPPRESAELPDSATESDGVPADDDHDEEYERAVFSNSMETPSRRTAAVPAMYDTKSEARDTGLQVFML